MDPKKKFLELKPRQASISRVFSVLSSADYVEECDDFINSRDAKQAIVGGRWIVFLSMMAQKLLLCSERLMLWLGTTLEMCLNVVGNKTNFVIFFTNLLRGKVELPERTSATYMSILGHLDKRVELDKHIQPGSHNYFAALSAMASKLAYENEEFIRVTVEEIWKMKLLGAYSFWDDRYKGSTTQVFMFRDINTKPDAIVVAFRGTEPFNAADWCTDFDISWCKLKGIKGRVHGGFVKALGLNRESLPPQNLPHDERRHAYKTLAEELNLHFNFNTDARLIVTGHSLGGALAVLFPAILAMHNEIHLLERLDAIYTFGQPKVGDEKFGVFMEELFSQYGVKYYRYVYGHDVVPRLPFDNLALMYKHFGTCIYVNSVYELKTVGEEATKKNLRELGLSILTDRVDALWEVVRSFLLPRMFGPDYRECLELRMFRILGLLFPGLTDHVLQDYINATRLAAYD